MATKKKKGKKRGPFTVLPRQTRKKQDPPRAVLATAMSFQSEEIAKLEKQIRGLKFAAEVVQKEHYKEIVQARCSHRKPNYMPAFAGQFDHHGVLHLVCVYCQHNVHFPKEYVDDIRMRDVDRGSPAAEMIRDSFGRFGGPAGAPVDLSAVALTFADLQAQAIEEKKRAIELCGFDPEELPVSAVAALILAIENAKKFMDGEKK